jgi:transposase
LRRRSGSTKNLTIYERPLGAIVPHVVAGDGACCASVFLPSLNTLYVEKVIDGGDGLQIRARTRAPQAVCPQCTAVCARVHARHERRLHDGVLGARPVVIHLVVRRFICGNTDCETKTFTEQVPGLTLPYRRRTVALLGVLENVAVALAGRAGARLAGLLGIVVHPSTLIRLIRALPEPERTSAPEILGVDDFALRRSRSYGTIIVDMVTGKAIDVLDTRDAEPFTRWLSEHPGARVICRDRAGAYAVAARDGAPDAIQCADRWHLWHNLAEHVERAVTRHHGCLKQAVSSTSSDSPSPASPPARQPPPAADSAGAPTAEQESALVARIRERYATIQALQADGQGLREIARQLDLDRKTVRRFAQASSADDLVARTLDRDTLLDAHKPYLHQRWNQGCRDIAVLHAELQQRGYRGSSRTLYRYLQPLRAADPAQAAAPVDPAPPKIRHVTTWLLRRPEDLDENEQATLADIRNACPHLDRLGQHITEFAKMMVNRTGAETLDTWLAAVEKDTIPELHTFARGIRQDYTAVRNGLSLPHNSGACEGNVNRLKFLKRQMFGRANTDLLRKRVVLHA